jgi:hypothetical protein
MSWCESTNNSGLSVSVVCIVAMLCFPGARSIIDHPLPIPPTLDMVVGGHPKLYDGADAVHLSLLVLFELGYSRTMTDCYAQPVSPRTKAVPYWQGN